MNINTIKKILTRKRTGSATAWMIVLFAMFTITIVYVFFSQIIFGIIPDAQAQIVSEDPTNNSTTTVNIIETFGTINTVWKYWPILLFLGLVIWAVVYSMRQEPNVSGGY